MVDLQNKPAEFESVYSTAISDSNARAKVPILESLEPSAGPTLVESMVICEYLDDITGQEYTPHQRAACRLWATLMPNWFAYVAILKTEPGSEDEKTAVHELRQGLRAADAFLSRRPEATSGPFLLGDRFSLAEIATAPFAQRFVAVLPGMRPDLEPRQILADDGLTRLNAWLDAVCARPSCSATIPPPEELVTSYTALLERMKAMGQPAT